MRLLYLDESGNTGTDFNNKHQPFFVLTGVCVEDKKWHEINDYFEEEMKKISPLFESEEIHANKLFNSNSESIFDKNPWQNNLEILEKLVTLISTLNIPITSAKILKKNYEKHFGNNIIDPYLYSFVVIYEKFNDFLKEVNDYGIVFCDELKNMENSLELLYPKLRISNKNIIEKTFYLNSKSNNFVQIADICSFYINKYNCIKNNFSTMSEFKKQHCIKMYEKLNNTILGKNQSFVPFEKIDFYFK